MISICIPVYNHYIVPLVTVLEEQIKKLNVTNVVEVVIIDDGSLNNYKELNKVLKIDHLYIELAQNIGRSKIRNLFRKYAKHQFLLFLDCDSMIIDDAFLEKYLTILTPNSVVYGGRKYPEKKPSKSQNLSWSYGVNVESKNAEIRRKEPYLSFMTNNFLIDKSLFDTIYFNERIANYGHEDTLFGYELFKNKIEIRHIENAVLNNDIEDNKAFVTKMESAVENLLVISKYYTDKGFFKYVKLLDYYNNVGFLKKRFFKYSFYLFGGLIRKMILSGQFSKKLIAFYKLGYFIKQNKIN